MVIGKILEKMDHILIVRTSSVIIDFKTYNCQEIGLGAALVRKGYRVSFITPGNKKEHIIVPVSGVVGGQIDVYTVTFVKINRNICFYHGFFKLLNQINPDLIHINSISLSMSYLSQLWARKNGKANVVIQGNYETTQKPILKQLETLFNSTIGTCIIKHADGIGGKTNWACEFVRKYCPTETMLTRIGLDIDKFKRRIDIDWHKKLGIEDKKVLLYVGIQEKRRNPMFLVDVISKLPENYVLIMVGSGPDVSEVNDHIEKLHLQKRCLQLGKLPQDQLPSLYEQSDLFLLASNYEIFGMVLLESMYFGLPVISTLTAGSDAIITSGVDGIVIDNLDVEVWTTNIKKLVDNKFELREMKRNAHAKIENQLVWDKTVNEFINLYNKAFSYGK